MARPFARRIANRISVATIADGRAVSPAGGIVLVRHPGRADVVHRRKDARRGCLKNRRRNREPRIHILWKRRLYDLDRRPSRKISLPGREKIMAGTFPSPFLRAVTAKAVEQACGKRDAGRSPVSKRYPALARTGRLHGQSGERGDEQRMGQKGSALCSTGTGRAFPSGQMNWRAVGGGGKKRAWSKQLAEVFSNAPKPGIR